VSTTETEGRVARKRGRRRQEIVAVAAELFGERGYDAVSLDDVAERLDVTKGSLYHYFSGKEELGSAAIEALGTTWTARLAELVERVGGPPGVRLRVLVREQLIVAVRDHPAGLGLFLVPDAWPDAQRAVIKELRRRHDRLFRDIVEEGIASGEFVVVDVDTTLHCLHAAVTQAPAWFAARHGAAFDQALDRLVDTVLMLVGVGPKLVS